jgi:hypothetical protein
MSRCIPQASVAYFRSIARDRGTDPTTLPADFVAEVEALREQVRSSEGGGGMCHFVTEILQNRYGWERLFVSYLAEDGRIICGGGHVVSILPDGSVLDTTRDQFGEGHSISFVSASSAEIGRYRPEFYEDFHPGHPDVETGVLDPWLDSYPGMIDADVDNANTEKLGRGWWLSDTTLLDAYDEAQTAYQSAYEARAVTAPVPR